MLTTLEMTTEQFEIFRTTINEWIIESFWFAAEASLVHAILWGSLNIIMRIV